MHELISHPGLQFYVLRLVGTLHYTLTIPDRMPKHYELNDADFEGVNLTVKEECFEGPQGRLASAVGIELMRVRNTGLLEIKFEGPHGGVAEWTYENLQERENIAGMAGTQTEQPKMVDGGMQTSQATTTNAGIQTEVERVKNPQTRTEYTSPAVAADEPYWAKAWPRHIFVAGNKCPLNGAGGVWGQLHIDRKIGEVWWREVDDKLPGSSLEQRITREQINLGFKELTVDIVSSDYPEESSYLVIWRKDAAGQAMIVSFSVTLNSGSIMWANDDKFKHGLNSTECSDQSVIVEEIKLCIDKTTERPCSVPHPKTDTPFRSLHE